MLTSMREGAKSGIMKFILFGFLVMAVFGLVLMDVGGVFRGGVGNATVANIAGEKLSPQQFDNAVRRVLARQSLDEQTAYQLGIIHRILQSEISSRLIRKSAQDAGIVIGDEMILKQIDRLVAPFVKDGMTKSQALRQILRAQGMTERAFIAAIKTEMMNTMMRNSIQLGTAFTPENLVHDLYQYRNEERTVELIKFDNKDITDLPASSDEVLLPLYQAGKERYAVPETRSFTVAVLSEETLKKTLEISEEELRQVYERDINMFTLPARRSIAQTIVETRQDAEAIAAKAKEDIASLAQATEDVTGNQDSFMGVQDFERQGLVEDIAEAAFNAEIGTIIGPIETPLGWHVLMVKGEKEPETKPFEEVRDQLRQDIMYNRLADEMFAYANAIDDRLAGGATLEDVAKEMGMEIIQVDPVRANGTTLEKTDGMKKFPDAKDEILELAFEMNQGESSPVIEIAGGRYISLRVDNIKSKSYTPFEDVRAEILAVWEKDQQDVLNRQKAQDALRALLSGDKSLNDLARENNASIQTVNIKREDENIPAPFTENARESFFNIPVGEYGLAQAEQAYLVGRIKESTLPAETDIADSDLTAIEEQVTGAVQNESLVAYLNYLRGTYQVKINENILSQTYGPGSQNGL